MIASWRDAHRLQHWAYPELAYHAIYAVRQGNLPPSIPPSELARKSQRRVTQSKLLVSGLLALVAFGTVAALRPSIEALLAPSLSASLYVTTVLVGLLVLELALLWWTGLQILPTFLSSQILPTFETLPIDAGTVEKAAFLLFLRLFDLPVLTILVATPLAVGVALNSPIAGLAILPGALSVVVFALGLSLKTGHFFVRHVQGSPGGSGRTVLRWAYLVLWATPAFAMCGFLTIGPRFVGWLSRLTSAGAYGIVDGVLALYPFPLASLPALVSGGAVGWPSSGSDPVAIVLLGSIAYSALTLAMASWLVGAPRLLAGATGLGHLSDAAPTRLIPRWAPFAVVVKDVRIASRTPGYAFLILLPLLDAAAIGIWTLFSGPTSADAFNIASAAVATAALLATFFGPAFFAIEVMGYSYTRTLPLSERSLVLGKVTLIGGLYALAAGIVLAIALTRLFEPEAFVAFILAEFPAVAAAAFLELGILVRIARYRGLPITNLYSGSWWAAAVTIPGLIVAGLPLALFEVTQSLWGAGALAAMGLVALAELAPAATFSLWGAGRGVR